MALTQNQEAFLAELPDNGEEVKYDDLTSMKRSVLKEYHNLRRQGLVIARLAKREDGSGRDLMVSKPVSSPSVSE